MPSVQRQKCPYVSKLLFTSLKMPTEQPELFDDVEGMMHHTDYKTLTVQNLD